jgi:signal transduction histidine kinase/CheY-like chemotaxis protein/CHASE1-domain containing sensor protein/integral membrane sensor domain MASE1
MGFGSRPPGYAWLLALGAVAYFAAAELGLALATIGTVASPVWPASGLAIVLIRRFGIRMWPAIALGWLAAGTPAIGIAAAVPGAIGSTIEGIAGALILRRLASLQSERFILASTPGYILAAAVAPVASASIGVAALWLAGSLPASLLQSAWMTWWIGDALGILTVAPVLLAPRPVGGARAVHLPAPARMAVLLAGGLLALALPALRPDADIAVYLAFPVVLLAARWHGARGAAIAVLAFAAGLVAEAAAGVGPFLAGAVDQGLINAQIFLATLAIAGLVLGELESLNLLLTGIVFAGAVAIGAIAFVGQNDQDRDAGRRRLNVLVQNATDRIQEQVGAYARALRTASGLFAASTSVERREWASFVGTMSLPEQFPGIVGVGAILPVAARDLDAFVAAQRADGMPDFTVRPIPGIAGPPPALDEHFVVTFIEPRSANSGAAGLDIASEPGRRRAAIEARDTGRPTLTPRITLVQDPSHRSGFLLLVPFYKDVAVPASQEERIRSFRGWVYAPFLVAEFVRPVMHAFGGDIVPEIFDGASTDPAARIAPPPAAAAGPAPAREIFADLPLRLVNHELTVRWWVSPDLLRAGIRDSLLLSCGIILLGTMLAAMVASIQSMRDKAVALAAEMNAALARTGEALRAAVDAMDSGFAMFDAEDRLTLFNKRFMGVTSGNMPPDPLGRGYEELMRAFAFGEPTAVDALPDRGAWLRWRMAVHRDPPPEPFEVQWTTGRWLRVFEHRLPDGGSIATWTDITHTKLMEQRFRAAVNVMEDGFGLFDAEDRIILHNDAFLDEGTRQELGNDVTGRYFVEILRAFAYHDMPVADPGFDREKWIEARLEQHRNPAPGPFEVKWSGERWMRISERRTPDGGYVGIWTDITRLKQAEARLRDAIDSVGEGFALFDAGHRFVMVNRRFTDLYPASGAAAVRGALFEDFLRLGAGQGEYPGVSSPEAIDGLVAQWRDVLDRRASRTGERQLGDGRWILFRHEPIPSGGYVLLCTDITAQKKREADLERAKAVLEAQAADLASLAAKLDQARQVAEAANDEKSAFLAMISHEIRTPLNGVLGLNHQLLATRLAPEQRELATAVEQSAEALLVIINDILDFSKLQAGKVTIEPAAFDLRQLIGTVLSVFRPRIEAKGLALSLDMPAECPAWIVSDAARLQQILYNLLGNAQKFTEAGQIELAVRHEALADGSLRLRFEVRDTGIGINREAQGRLFARFSQADSSITRRFGGTGLGLAISKQLAELLGGEIGVQSTPGKGSRFWFTILCRPGVRPAAGDGGGAEAGVEPGAASPAAGAGRPLRILVAEDNHINQLVVIGLLKRMGHQADAVANGLEAIEAHRQKAYDVILMDVQMPEMDGKTATLRIRAMEGEKAGVPIIAVTANAMDTHREEYLAAGMNDFVAKPIRAGELAAAIGRCVGVG